MYNILSCVRDEHNIVYVLAAVLVCAIGACCSVLVFRRAQAGRTLIQQRIWAAVSGLVLATGIWATHFIAMLGYRPGFAFDFDGVTTVASVLVAMGGLVGVSQLLIGGTSRLRRLVAGLASAATIGIMHFYGATALKEAAFIEFDMTYVGAAVAVSSTLFCVAFYVGFGTASRLRVAVSTACLLLAVASVHFIGMTAMNVIPMNGFHAAAWAVDPALLGAVVAGGVIVIIIAGALAAGLDSAIAGLRFREQRKFSLLVNAATEAILIADGNDVIVEVNEAAQTLFEQSEASLIGQTVASLTGLDRDERCTKDSDDVFVRVGKTEVPVAVSARDLDDSGAGLAAISFYDLRERRRNEEHIRKLAYSDQLTGLPNRAAFQKALGELWRSAEESGQKFSVFLIDLDEFKDVNDQFGHGAGDTVLTEAATRLRLTFGAEAIVSRLGGDEFAALLPDEDDDAKLVTLAEELVLSLSRPIRHGEVTVRTGASVGIAISNTHEGIIDPAGLLTAADRALYAAKGAGRRTSRLYDEALHELSEQKRVLEADLVRAVERKEFVLHYQPKVCTDTRATVGYEALIRWNRPGVGLVMPGEFIEFAERSLIIQDIGRWCIYEACREAAQWESGLSVSVNLSARQFMDPNLNSTIRDALRRSGLEPERLELEITETALIQNIMVASRILEKIKKLGVKVALDDFGTGYSSLSFIQKFQFDRIKIDRSFISTMGTDRKSQAIVDAILNLGSSLEIPVVAEGVETEDQARELLLRKCREFQGFLISKPKPIETGAFSPRVAVDKAS